MNPLISFIIFTYKQEDYIAEALKGAVSQDYDNLEIIVMDDCSPDNTYGVIEKFAKSYKGVHKLTVHRNEPNLGLVGNINRGISLAHGDYIVVAAGDDVSLPGRTTAIYEALKKSGVESLTMSYKKIDKDGNVKPEDNEVAETGIKIFTLDDYLTGNYRSSGCNRIFTKKIFDVFGPLNNDCSTEDSTINLRAFLLGGLGYENKENVYYRVHGENISLGENYYKRINAQSIYNQYLKDTTTALEKGLIDECAFDKVKAKIDKYLLRETSLRTMYDKGTFWKRLMWVFKAVLSSERDYRLKKTLVRTFLAWSFK